MNVAVLPDGYEERTSIDLQKNVKLAVGVNLAALGIAAVLFVIGWLIVPFSTLILDMASADSFLPSPAKLLLKFAVMLVGIFLYMVLHEAVHGIFMRYYGKRKPRFGLTLLYAYCGSDAYFDKKSYLVIGLAPVVIWGIVLLAAGFLVPVGWFWVVYLIQIVNLSGAAGDFYVTYRMLRLPPDILVQDSGTSMIIFAPVIEK